MNDLGPTTMEEALRLARASEGSLMERLNIIKEAARAIKPDYAAAADAFAQRLASARAGENAPEVGDLMPPFTLPDETGRLVSLDDLLDQGPVVVAFHRGHWCPFCRLNMAGLAEIEELARPAQIVAISTETQRYTRMLKAESGASFPFLTDLDAAYTLSINLAVWMDTRLSQIVAKAGWDVPLYQGGNDWVMPLPAVFVLNQQGTIVTRHIDPDYRQRMELDELLRSVDMLRG